MQVVNFHIKLIEHAGLKLIPGKKFWAKPILGFDLDKKDGWRFKSRDKPPFIQSVDYFDVPQKPLVMICCAYLSDSFARYAVVVWDGNAIHRTTIRTEATKWAMDITAQVEDLFNLIKEGQPWEHYIDTKPLQVDLLDEGDVATHVVDEEIVKIADGISINKINKKIKSAKTAHSAAKAADAFGVVKITPQRKELIEAINELSEKCPGMSLWSTLLIAVGDKKDTDISDEDLIDLVFDYTMSIAGENLALD